MAGSASYVVYDVDLATVASKAPIDGQEGYKGSLVNFVQVLSVPAGADVSLHFGRQNDAVPVNSSWFGAEFEEGHDGGIFYTVPSVQAGTMKLAISFGGCP